MKKMAIGVFIVAVLLILTPSAAKMEQPPGIGPAGKSSIRGFHGHLSEKTSLSCALLRVWMLNRK